MQTSKQRAKYLAIFLCSIMGIFASCDSLPLKKEDKAAKGGPKDSEVTLTWDGSTDGSIVTFKVYVSGEETELGSLIDTVDATDPSFDTDAPIAVLNTKANTTLGEFKGKRACFTVAALDQDKKESERSSPACTAM